MGDIFVKSRDWIVSRSGLEDFIAETAKKTVPKHALNPVYCLGGITFVAFLLLAFTGIFLANYYEPSVIEAQASVQRITVEIPFGFYARSIHAWSANIMGIAILLHTLRVFVTGSYKKPRELTWIGGVVLMILTFSFILSGYILPLDTRSVFTLDILSDVFGWVQSIPIVGGLLNWFSGATEDALSGAYWMHVTVLPLTIVLFLLAHFYLIRKHGISGPL